MNDATIGHNSEGAPANDPLLERLNKSYKPQMDIRDEIVAAFDRIPTKEIVVYGKTLKAVPDEKWKQNVGAFVKKCRALMTQAKDIHSDEKKELLATTRRIDNFFLADIVKRVEALKVAAEQLVANYDAQAIEEEENRLAEIAKIEREKAVQLQKEADERAAAIKTEDDLGVAIDAQDDAQHAQQVAMIAQADARNINPLDVTRTTSSAGVTQSTQVAWTGRILNLAEIDLNQLKADFKLADIETAVAKFGKRTQGTQQLAGVVVERDFRSRTR